VSKARPLILFVQWFGPWPEWIEIFVESCKWNPEVDWLIFTDQQPPENKCPNVRFRNLSFKAHLEHIGQRIGLRLDAADPYKLCDLKPCLGFAYEDLLGNHEFFGYCDLDVVFGNIRDFYTNDLLNRFDVISTHGRRLAGHFTILRNDVFRRNAFRRIRHWRRKARNARPSALDEKRFGEVFLRPSLWRQLTEPRARVLLEEQFSTPWSTKPWLDGSHTYPPRWYWRDGKLTAEGYGDRQFLYLHFLTLKSDRFRNQARYGPAPWPALPRIVSIDWRNAGKEGFMISAAGITAIPQSAIDAIHAPTRDGRSSPE